MCCTHGSLFLACVHNPGCGLSPGRQQLDGVLLRKLAGSRPCQDGLNLFTMVVDDHIDMDLLLDTNLDDLLRTALTIADRGLVPHEESREWYGEVVLGELSIAEFLARIKERLKDPALASLLSDLKWKVPFRGNPVVRTPATAAPA